jgi:hypothetical protein
MKIPFQKVPDAQDFTPVPDGEYLCRLTSVEESETKEGDGLWKMHFVIDEGEHSGSYIFDNLIFSEKALPRAKHICQELGLDTSGELDLTPAAIMDRKCYLSVTVEAYEVGGVRKQKNKVLFTGYRAVESF